MENNNYEAGDLADIFGRPGSVNSRGGDTPGVSDWPAYNFDDDHQSEDTQMMIHQKSTTRSRMMIHDIDDDNLQEEEEEGFGQPLFTSLLNSDHPLLLNNIIHEEITTPSSSCFFGNTHHHQQQQSAPAAPPPSRLIMPSSSSLARRFEDHHNHQHNNNIFSKMLQISPAANAKSTSSAEIMTASINSSSSNSSSSKRGLLETTTTTSGGLQISSPRNPAAIKRRKSQAKKVVCIPAPTPANSRPTGEVVPSDLWAWRKYGQKPIKGSPYPRGYYRCSSSKGCSARKQVERSRTDPNMLVITYTSEHNHPWPTQRNALAGSTRTPQTPKTAAAEQPPPPHQKQEKIEDDHDHHQGSSTIYKGGLGVQVKDEIQPLKIEGISTNFPHHQLQGYRPELPDQHGGRGGQPTAEDFFSGLGEIEVDPIAMLLNQGFLDADDQDQPQTHYNKDDLDPFC